MFAPRTRTIAALAATLALSVAGAAPAQAANDPLLPEQWALTNPDATGAPEAWTQSLGDGVVVAILDSGVQFDHPDLARNLWTNPGELAGNGVDDDRNGFVDDVHGANIVSPGASADDDEGHGTHVAGIVAARGGNGTGGAGIAPRARIMAVKVLDASRAGNSTLLARGIRYAVDEGARILNVSLNGDGTSPDLDAALAYADDRGATVVASAGNNSRDLDVRPSYPASSTLPAVLSVTATEPSGDLLSIANRGLNSVDMAAPGASVLSTARGSGSGAFVALVAVSRLLAVPPEDGEQDVAEALVREARTCFGASSVLLAEPHAAGRLRILAGDAASGVEKEIVLAERSGLQDLLDRRVRLQRLEGPR
ncbi:MAG: S8 family serine peptidase, partial [Actinobacteria bacterium]|nr:S8 family serine peptidase [Actinomycetota bacterium]